MHETRTTQATLTTEYNRKQPPPSDPPEGVTEVTAWQLAAAQWRAHLPDALLGVDCVVCRAQWPCDAWNIANDVITDCHHTAELV